MESITDILGISGYKYESMREEGAYAVIEIRYEARPGECGHCGSRRMHSHGWRRRRVSHAPAGIRLCDLEVSHQRWRCTECRRVQTPALPGIGRRARLSDMFKGFVGHIVFHLGAGLEAVRRWLRHGWNTLQRCLPGPGTLSLETVRHLCLDEVFFREPRRFLTVLSDPERGVALECLPNAEVAADCFHVVRLATKAVRESNASQRPQAVQAARELRRLLKGNSELALHGWIARWKKSAGPLKTLVTTLSRWDMEIAAYISTRRSTGPAEALNRKISLLRRACGYTNLDNFIGMILSLQPSSHHKE